MSPYVENLKRMMTIWNTTDAKAKAELAESVLEHNVHFADPNHNIVGRDAFLKMVEQTQAQIPGATYAQASTIGYQNNFCRYHWVIKKDDAVLMTGFDMVEVNDSGKIAKVIGFFGELERETV